MFLLPTLWIHVLIDSLSLFISFSCSFNWEQFLCLFIVFSFVSMNLDETATYCAFEGVFLCRSVPVWTVCLKCLWGGGLDLMWVHHVFHVCWLLSRWYEVWLVLEKLETTQGVTWDIISDQWPSSLAPKLFPSCLIERPECWAWAGSIPFKCMFFLLPSLGLCPKGRVLMKGACALTEVLPV